MEKVFRVFKLTKMNRLALDETFPKLYENTEEPESNLLELLGTAPEDCYLVLPVFMDKDAVSEINERNNSNGMTR